MTPNLYQTFAVACALIGVQVLAAIPWLFAADRTGFLGRLRSPSAWLGALIGIAGAGAALTAWMVYQGDPAKLKFDGRVYASVLQLQLSVDVVLALLGVALLVWPKGGTVALAAFREGYRQPMFWFIGGVVALLLVVSMVIPYFTFGEDFKMMKQISFDMIKISTVLFAVLAASISVSEEIEGRTAVTLMSKPVKRSQFLLGKYFGILLAALLLTLLLGWFQNWVLSAHPHFLRLEDAFDPLAVEMQRLIEPAFTWPALPAEAASFVTGIGDWAGEVLANGFGLALGFGQVMVMLAVAVSLATRLAMVVTVVLCLIFYLLGNLAPILAQVSEQLSKKAGGALNLVSFLAQLLDKILPSLSFFSTDQVFLRETYLDPMAFGRYSLSVVLYAALYSAMALFVGLFLIEDRDLA
jgi:hypothetical protein